jgi:hypothetical protein
VISIIKADGSQITAHEEFHKLQLSIREWVIANCTKKYNGYLHKEGQLYILIALGRVPTRGYHLQIDDLAAILSSESLQDPLRIKVRMTTTTTSARTMRVISYPMLLFWVKAQGHEVVIFEYQKV